MDKLTIQAPKAWYADANENLVVECEAGKVSDGYHTFDELYDHRCLLFMAFLKLGDGWKSLRHHDGSSWDGWFIAGCILNGKQISYHLPIKFWILCPVQEFPQALEWDGHTSNDVLERLTEWIAS